MVIAYQSSEMFSDICMVSLYSLLKNNLEEKNIFIYIISKDFSQKSLDNIKRMCDRMGFGNATVQVIDINNIESRFDLIFDDYNGKWGIDSFCKLLLGSLLPREVSRVLYLDSDTIVCRNLRTLYETDLDNYVAAAVKDFLGKSYFEYFGLDDEDIYCNSGVLLINLNNWRKYEIETKIKEYLKKNNGKIFFSEQTVFNVVCKKNICSLGLANNLTSIPALLDEKDLVALRKPYNSYEIEEIIEARNNPLIIHFTTLFLIMGRAWHIRNNHPFNYIFDEYANDVPEFEKKALSWKSMFKSKLICIIPRNILCKVVGYYYSKIRLNNYTRYCKEN